MSQANSRVVSALLAAVAAALLLIQAVIASNPRRASPLSSQGHSPALAVSPAVLTLGGDSPIEIKTTVERGAILSSASPQSLHLKLEIIGDDAAPSQTERAPLNVAFVLDKSGSMNGDNKWGYVRQAMEDAFSRAGVDDFISLVAYDTDVKVVIPPTRHLDVEWAKNKLSALRPDGSTNIHGALKKGAELVREHHSDRCVNRVILLSDGLANVGPSSVNELRALAESVSGQGVVVSTISVGLDFNEDAMFGMARDSGGAFYFIDEPRKIATIFDEELRGIMSAVARDIEVVVKLPAGVAYRQSLDKGEYLKVEGNKLTLRLPEVLARQKWNLLLELEISGSEAGAKRELAQVEASFKNLSDNASGSLSGRIVVDVTDSREVSDASVDPDVVARVYQMRSAHNRLEAYRYIDQGRMDDARAVYRRNADMLRQAPAAVRSRDSIGSELTGNQREWDSLEDYGADRRVQAERSRENLMTHQ